MSPGVADDRPDRRKALVLGIVGFLVTTAGLAGSLAVVLWEVSDAESVESTPYLLVFAPLAAPTALAGLLVGLSARRATLAGGIAAWAVVYASVIVLDLNGIPPFDSDPEQWIAFTAIFGAVGSAAVLGVSSLVGWAVVRIRR